LTAQNSVAARQSNDRPAREKQQNETPFAGRKTAFRWPKTDFARFYSNNYLDLLEQSAVFSAAGAFLL
jgi:hypothetical protein